MNGKDGKPFKTRDGGVMRLEYLLKDINEEMLKKIQESRPMEEERSRGDREDRRSVCSQIRRFVQSGFQGLYF